MYLGLGVCDTLCAVERDLQDPIVVTGLGSTRGVLGAESREQRAESREQRAKSREQRAERAIT